MVGFVEQANNSARAIEELLVEFVPHAGFQTLFSNFSAQSQPAICRNINDNLYLPIPQYL